MNPNDLNVPIPPSEAKVPALDETKKLSFWVSQLFILLATVLGVYLASSQGFRQALAYGEIQAARSNYYLRASLRGEIADNLPLVREYMQSIKTGGPQARKAPMNLETFVWESMRNSPATLETPPELLREASRFYRELGELERKAADNSLGIQVLADRLRAVVDRVEKDLLPKFDADAVGLRKRLAEGGLRVD